MINRGEQIMDKSHGSPYDRGSADAYYMRGFDPHWWPEGTNHGKRIEADAMTEQQLKEYEAGWKEQTEYKEWD